MGGDWGAREAGKHILCLNPPRPHGRGRSSTLWTPSTTALKSTPPAWAGTTACCRLSAGLTRLNPPRPHGRGRITKPWTPEEEELKSTPPAWAGTFSHSSSLSFAICLNPPRPHGRGQNRYFPTCHRRCLNPPRPHGRGQQKFTKIGSAILLPLEEMIKDI